MPRARNIEGVCVPLPDLKPVMAWMSIVPLMRMLLFSLPRGAHQKDEFTRQVNILSAIVIFNVLPCLVENQLCVFYLGGSKSNG